jgi:anti-sigma factor RsiW
MIAPHLGELLSAYLDGELPPAEQGAVLAHLRECAACRVELAELDVARTAVRALPLLEAPPLVAPEQVAAVIPLHQRWSVRIAAAAAAGVIAVAGFGALRGGSASPTIDVDTAVEQHIARVVVDPGFTGANVVSVVARR